MVNTIEPGESRRPVMTDGRTAYVTLLRPGPLDGAPPSARIVRLHG